VDVYKSENLIGGKYFDPSLVREFGFEDMVNLLLRDYLNRIKSWIDMDWRISFKVIYREQNKVADRLAGGGSMYREEFVTFADCPRMSEEAYFDDLAHVSCVRKVVESD